MNRVMNHCNNCYSIHKKFKKKKDSKNFRMIWARRERAALGCDGKRLPQMRRREAWVRARARRRGPAWWRRLGFKLGTACWMRLGFELGDGEEAEVIDGGLGEKREKRAEERESFIFYGL